MPIPLIETELRSYVLTQLPSLTITIGDRPAVGSGIPVNLSTIYSQGGETEERFRFRIITRADSYQDCLSTAEDIFNELHRLHSTDLTTFRLYMVTGERPQFIGHEEDGSFLASADYVASFSRI